MTQIAWHGGHARTAHRCRFWNSTLSVMSEETVERQPAAVVVRPALLAGTEEVIE